MPRYVIEVPESSNDGCGCFVPLLLGFAWGFIFIMFAKGC